MPSYFLYTGVTLGFLGVWVVWLHAFTYSLTFALVLHMVCTCELYRRVTILFLIHRPSGKRHAWCCPDCSDMSFPDSLIRSFAVALVLLMVYTVLLSQSWDGYAHLQFSLLILSMLWPALVMMSGFGTPRRANDASFQPLPRDQLVALVNWPHRQFCSFYRGEEEYSFFPQPDGYLKVRWRFSRPEEAGFARFFANALRIRFRVTRHYLVIESRWTWWILPLLPGDQTEAIVQCGLCFNFRPYLIQRYGPPFFSPAGGYDSWEWTSSSTTDDMILRSSKEAYRINVVSIPEVLRCMRDNPVERVYLPFVDLLEDACTDRDVQLYLDSGQTILHAYVADQGRTAYVRYTHDPTATSLPPGAESLPPHGTWFASAPDYLVYAVLTARDRLTLYVWLRASDRVTECSGSQDLILKYKPSDGDWLVLADLYLCTGGVMVRYLNKKWQWFRVPLLATGGGQKELQKGMETTLSDVPCALLHLMSNYADAEVFRPTFSLYIKN